MPDPYNNNIQDRNEDEDRSASSVFQNLNTAKIQHEAEIQENKDSVDKSVLSTVTHVIPHGGTASRRRVLFPSPLTQLRAELASVQQEVVALAHEKNTFMQEKDSLLQERTQATAFKNTIQAEYQRAINALKAKEQEVNVLTGEKTDLMLSPGDGTSQSRYFLSKKRWVEGASFERRGGTRRIKSSDGGGD